MQRLSESGSAASPRRRRYTTASTVVGVVLRMRGSELQLHSQASVPYPSIEMS